MMLEKVSMHCNWCGEDFVLGHWIVKFINPETKEVFLVHKFCEEKFLTDLSVEVV